MALTYRAPGVYVEEIPSARQPIAGVGTNTVGFIGLIRDDSVYIPVVNPDYDPVLAQHLFDFHHPPAAVPQALQTDLRPGEADAAQRAATQALQTELNRVTTELGTVQANVDDLTNNRVPQAQDAVHRAETQLRDATDANRADLERDVRNQQTQLTRAQRELRTATQRRDELQQLRDELSNQLPASGGGTGQQPGSGTGQQPGGGTGQQPVDGAPAAFLEVEDLDYAPVPPNPALLVPSRLRPYYLKEFKIQVDEFDTKLCTNFTEYMDRFGDFSAFKDEAENPHDDPSKWIFKPLNPGHHLLTQAVDGFFRNGGTRCFVARVKDTSHLDKMLREFESIEELAILAAPGLPKGEPVWGRLQDYCENDTHQNVFAILDLPAVVNDGKTNDFEIEKLQYDAPEPLLPERSAHAACYFPFIEVVDPAKQLQDSDPARQVPPKYRGRTYVAPSGHVAGIYARTDEERGVHKAPANATVRGAIEVKYYISRPKQELLNPQGVNCIRLMNGDVTVWGARTVGGDRNGEWKYVPVRRFAGFLEESIKRGTQWIVFEPNDPGLWSRIILNVTAFLTILWHNGALFGLTPQEAFYVKCDEELNPPEIRDLGQVITEIGVAIVRPAEFVIFRITQSTGPRQG